jgi:septal ring factor EnvC (AmiA/AmiB activator)
MTDEQVTSDPVPTPAQLAAAAPEALAVQANPEVAEPEALAVQANPEVAEPEALAVQANPEVAAPEALAVQANPEAVAHSDSLLTKVARDFENSKLVIAAEQAKQQALLAVVAETKAGIDKLHSELTAFTSAIKVEEQKIVSWTETHKTKVALIVIATVAIAWFVVTKL